MSSSILGKLRKKRGFPVSVQGEDYFIRSLTLGELRRLESLPVESKTAFALCCALCANAEGQPAFPKDDAEDDAKWAQRIADDISDVPTETIRALSQAVADIGKPTSPASIAKN